MGLRASILKPISTIYLASIKKHPIHILDFTESLRIHILYFDLIYPFIQKMCAYTWVSDLLGHSYTFFVKGGRGIIYLASLNKEAIRHLQLYHVIDIGC